MKDFVFNLQLFAKIKTVKLTKKADSYTNRTQNVKISALGGNDFIENYASNVTIDGGSGNDKIYIYDGKNVKAYGGTGNDNINAGLSKKAVKLDGGNGNDTLFGGDGNDSLVGGKGNDSLYGCAGNDTLIGGKGNDILHGGFGKNVYVYANGDGNDTISSYSSAGIYGDKIKITSGSIKKVSYSNYGDVIFTIGSGTLTLKYCKGKKITIIDSKGKTTTKVYGSSSYQTAELFAENNFATADNLSEIVKNDLTPTALEKISPTNFENLTQENNFVTYSEK